MDDYSIVQVRGQFEALLLQPVLEPLTEAFGEYSEIAASAFAAAVAKAIRV
jgi:hypothetical protein